MCKHSMLVCGHRMSFTCVSNASTSTYTQSTDGSHRSYAPHSARQNNEIAFRSNLEREISHQALMLLQVCHHCLCFCLHTLLRAFCGDLGQSHSHMQPLFFAPLIALHAYKDSLLEQFSQHASQLCSRTLLFKMLEQ